MSDQVQAGVDRLLQEATAVTGLTDFGPDSFREGLGILYRSNLDGGASPELLAMHEQQYIKALTNRLKLYDYVKQHPEVLEEKIKRPLFVIGMPRSGTTITSYLLDQDPARRSLLLWEAWNSVPPPTSETLRTDPRCLAMLEAQQRELSANPNEVRPHVEFADGPTECIRLHAQEFKALMWEMWMPVREYSRWVMQADMTSAYEYQKLSLQVLQSRAPGTWSLKMPSHALHIDALVKVFPDARIVWVHRDPYKSLSSLFSMKSRRWKKMTGDANIPWLREHYINQMAEHLNRPMRLRDRLGQDRIIDVAYAAMLRDPIAGMRELYAKLGDAFTPEIEQRMQRWLDENPQGRFGKHSYGLEEFGLSEAMLRPHFEKYFSQHATEREG